MTIFYEFLFVKFLLLVYFCFTLSLSFSPTNAHFRQCSTITNFKLVIHHTCNYQCPRSMPSIYCDLLLYLLKQTNQQNGKKEE
ncbi:hypothetical protein CPC08DRAFT_210685 [Agrocybe pediades]|nr:hypothetical protein CPC08DRAFT_210685 [Agrocybe pediades]